MDIDRLAEVNARLSRTRDEYRDALTAQHKMEMEESGTRLPSAREEARKAVQSACGRTRRAEEQYHQTVDEFIKFTSGKRSA